jgi:hypothetical protein
MWSTIFGSPNQTVMNIPCTNDNIVVPAFDFFWQEHENPDPSHWKVKTIGEYPYMQQETTEKIAGHTKCQ